MDSVLAYVHFRPTLCTPSAELEFRFLYAVEDEARELRAILLSIL